MPNWKILLTGVLACVCLALMVATFLVPMVYEGTRMWLWLGGFVLPTLVACALFAVFLRHASGSLDAKTRGTRY
ncbi:MAG: hypothetical protein FJ304_04720 [Planctomycetes bacterium]|nr:hypothetical protein [Planctomycetota bacterium]